MTLHDLALAVGYLCLGVLVLVVVVTVGLVGWGWFKSGGNRVWFRRARALASERDADASERDGRTFPIRGGVGAPPSHPRSRARR